MKTNKTLIWSIVLMVIVTALCRVIPGLPANFAPVWAVAIFGGAVIKDKRFAFAIPVVAMLLSDLIFYGLYQAGYSSIRGFYQGEWINCILFGTVALFGYLVKKVNVRNVLIAAIAAPTYFFIVSNFLTWAGVGDFVEYPKTLQGLMDCYIAAIPFYGNSVLATLLFSGVLFGAWHFISRSSRKEAIA